MEILNIFDMESQSTIVKSVVESADSGIESADSTADSATNPLKIGLWVWAFSGYMPEVIGLSNLKYYFLGKRATFVSLT